LKIAKKSNNSTDLTSTDNLRLVFYAISAVFVIQKIVLQTVKLLGQLKDTINTIQNFNNDKTIF
jgi:hypothetical protein